MEEQKNKLIIHFIKNKREKTVNKNYKQSFIQHISLSENAKFQAFFFLDTTFI